MGVEGDDLLLNHLTGRKGVEGAQEGHTGEHTPGACAALEGLAASAWMEYHEMGLVLELGEA